MNQDQSFDAENSGPQRPLDDLRYPAPDLPQTHMVLAVQLGLSLFLSLIGVAVIALLFKGLGWNETLMQGGLNAESGVAERWQMRLLLGISHLMAFLLSGAATVWVFYKTRWPDYLQTRKMPSASQIGWSIALLVAALPVVFFLYEFNKNLPLPDSLRVNEAQIEAQLKGLLRMDTLWELFANLTVIALLPALGEELVFRGVVQRQLMRRLHNPMFALTVTAAIFSFIHFQFEGFLPRMALGWVLGWLYWRTGNFWLPVIAHGFNNGIQVIAQYLYGQQLSSVNLENDVTVPWYVAAVAAGLVWWIAGQIKTADPQNSPPYSPEARRYN